MPQITVATLQLDGASGPHETRLHTAAEQIQHAAQAGAQLVVLPARFNTGYDYHETHYERTETLRGPTLAWMRDQAAQHQVYLAGSLLVVDDDYHTYHAAFIISPSGQQWRFDQQYPFLWERVFFRNGHRLHIAETPLGRIGVVLGWDAAHSGVWDAYANHAQLILLLDTTPDFSAATLTLADGATGGLFALAQEIGEHAANYRYDLPNQAEWLKIPVVASGTSGQLDTILPAPYFSALALMLDQSPRPTWQQAPDLHLHAPFNSLTGIISATGETVAQVDTPQAGYAIATVTLNDAPVHPTSETQPETSVPMWVLWFVDTLVAGFLLLNYRRGIRRQWGARYAPVDNATWRWLTWVLMAVSFGIMLGRAFQRRKTGINLNIERKHKRG